MAIYRPEDDQLPAELPLVLGLLLALGIALMWHLHLAMLESCDISPADEPCATDTQCECRFGPEE